MNYAKAIKTLRATAGLRQKDLAERLDVDASYISLLEQNKRSPSMEFIQSLSRVVGVPVYLIMLLASEEQDLRGIDEKSAAALGAQLLDFVVKKSS